MIDHDQSLLAQLAEYLLPFRAAFGRRDRLPWAAVYLHGLLAAAGRKTVGRLARGADLPPNLDVEDVTQALQNFVNQSSWDERLVWRRHRELIAERLADADGLLLIEEVAFVKQGRHSVGVQRQYSSILGGKLNCQVAVALSHAGPEGVYPLALRLYLPRGWLQDPARLDAAGVPAEQRRPQSRGTVALELLEELRAEGWPMRPVVVGPSLATDVLLREALNDSSSSALPAHQQIWQERGRRQQQTLFVELGLDNFEGRSWRGFHHHACLVMLACGFRALKWEEDALFVLA